jgi:hypothetical protein
VSVAAARAVALYHEARAMGSAQPIALNTAAIRYARDTDDTVCNARRALAALLATDSNTATRNCGAL